VARDVDETGEVPLHRSPVEQAVLAGLRDDRRYADVGRRGAGAASDGAVRGDLAHHVAESGRKGQFPRRGLDR